MKLKLVSSLIVLVGLLGMAFAANNVSAHNYCEVAGCTIEGEHTHSNCGVEDCHIEGEHSHDNSGSHHDSGHHSDGHH